MRGHTGETRVPDTQGVPDAQMVPDAHADSCQPIVLWRWLNNTRDPFLRRPRPARLKGYAVSLEHSTRCTTSSLKCLDSRARRQKKLLVCRCCVKEDNLLTKVRCPYWGIKRSSNRTAIIADMSMLTQLPHSGWLNCHCSRTSVSHTYPNV